MPREPLRIPWKPPRNPKVRSVKCYDLEASYDHHKYSHLAHALQFLIQLQPDSNSCSINIII